MKTPKILITMFTVTIIAIGYVNQQALVYQMGLNVKENNNIYSNLVDHNRMLVYNVLNLKSPVSLQTRLLSKEVELDMPHRWQVVKLEGSPENIIQNDVAKRGLFANLFIRGREAEASPNSK